MRTPSLFKPLSWALAALAAARLAAPAIAAEGTEGITAVASRASKDYVRTLLADGTPQPEAYAFGKGGYWGEGGSDPTIDAMSFMDVARVIAGALAEKRYVPDKDPNKTRLLIMVYWGTTGVPDRSSESVAYQNYGSEMQEANLLMQSGSFGATAAADAMMSAALQQLNMEDNRRDRIDYKNAIMLGYNSPDGAQLIGTSEGRQLQFSALRNAHNDLVREIESPRYFVVLMAYDFQLMWKQKKAKLLWETRFSINQPRNDFGRALPAMARYASQYFGKDSRGLVREVIREGRVEIQAPTLIELLKQNN